MSPVQKKKQLEKKKKKAIQIKVKDFFSSSYPYKYHVINLKED